MNKYALDTRKPYTVRIKMGTNNTISTEFGIRFSIEHEQDEDGNETDTLVYFNFERGHAIHGSVTKYLKRGLVFKASYLEGWTFTVTEMTLDEFDEFIRPNLPEETSRLIHTLDDACVWLRRQAEIV